MDGRPIRAGGAGGAFLGPVPYTPATLIDDQTGQAETIDQTGCYAVQPPALEPLDLSWVLFNCGSLGTLAPELYSPATGEWQAVSPSQGVFPVCGGPGCSNVYYAEGAGSSWLEYDDATCGAGGQHCWHSNLFQNIVTGEVRQDPSGGSTAVDLNAPNLTVTVCQPLTVPTTFGPYAPGPVPGSLTFYGSFALATGGDENGAEVYLERCGTHLHRLLTRAPIERPPVVAANTHEVVWMAHAGPFLNALTLPGLRPFTIRLPNRLVASTCSPDDYSTCVTQIALTSHRLYLLTATYAEQVWAAPNPMPARRQHK